MKATKLSLIAILAIGIPSISSASSLQEALTSGKISGEFAVTYEQRDMDNELAKWGNYYNNTDYSVGSFALKYESGIWNNLSLTSKLRAYKTIFEGGEDEFHYQGKGDAAERFWYKDGSRRSVDLEELFLAYNYEAISVKAGRQFISTDWMNKTQDALRIDANFDDTSIEAIWSQRHGRIYSRDYRPMTKMNENKGVYKIALTQKFNENISATAYDFIAPDNRDIIGGKVNLKYGDTSFRAHYAVNKPDDSNEEDSSIIDLMLSTSIAGFTPYVGYIQIDKDQGFTHLAGEIINPFEEGDQIYLKDARTYYLGLSKSFGDLSATLLYGNTQYDKADESYDQDETTLWLGYKLTSELSANLGLTHVNVDNDDLDETDVDQVNLTLTYSF